MKTFKKETLYRPKTDVERGWRPSTAHHGVPKWRRQGKRRDRSKRGRIKAKKSYERNWVTTTEKRDRVSPAYTVFWQSQGILYTTHFCLSPRGSWHVGLISFIFLPGLKATRKECRLAVLPNCSGSLFKYGIVTTLRLCGMRVLNNSDHVETGKSILNQFFDREKDCRRGRIITENKSTWQASDCLKFPHILTSFTPPAMIKVQPE